MTSKSENCRIIVVILRFQGIKDIKIEGRIAISRRANEKKWKERKEREKERNPFIKGTILMFELVTLGERNGTEKVGRQ